jgi:HAD superfamily hydrolase (TIGR01509 family)
MGPPSSDDIAPVRVVALGSGGVVRALLWDNDGVLVDTEPLYFQATRELLGELGIELTRERFADLSLRQGRSCLDLAAGLGLAKDELEAIRQRRNARYAALLGAGVEPMPGVVDCLRRLHGSRPMAIVTSSNPDHFALAHARTGLAPFFEFVLTNADYARTKPHPEPYLTAAERLGVDPASCLVVEDTERGLQAARAAGMRCVVVPGELCAGGDFRAADAVLASVSEVPDAVARIAGTS